MTEVNDVVVNLKNEMKGKKLLPLLTESLKNCLNNETMHLQLCESRAF